MPSAHIRRLLGLVAAVGCGALLASPAHAANQIDSQVSQIDFQMVHTKDLPAGCAPNATARVHVDTSPGFTEKLVITVRGFEPNTPLVLFAIQVPNKPFGIGWYEGDVAIGPQGWVRETFISRFNNETFAVAVGTAGAPQTHTAEPFPDADENPVFNPVHTYHLGIWFDSVEAAKANGCPEVQTPFNGDHTAGPQVLNTGNFEDDEGPLLQIQ
jgi:hypothetical protein